MNSILADNFEIRKCQLKSCYVIYGKELVANQNITDHIHQQAKSLGYKQHDFYSAVCSIDSLEEISTAKNRFI